MKALDETQAEVTLSVYKFGFLPEAKRQVCIEPAAPGTEVHDEQSMNWRFSIIIVCIKC